jgi:TPR repeat protein
MQASRDQIRDVLLAANRCVNDPKCTAADVMLVLGPYLECTEVTGVSEWASSGGIGLVHALAGDAYRKDKNFTAAAQWYRKASERGVAHAIFYARVVCEAALADYYVDALATVERQRSQWRRRSFFERISCQLQVAHTWFDPDWWYYKRHEQKDYAFLKRATNQTG